MRSATPMPIDKFGNPVPVFCPDTGETEVLTIATEDTAVAQTVSFAKEAKTYASYANNTTENSGLTITSKLSSEPKTSITIESAGTASVVVTGRDIVVTPETGEISAAEVAALINASVAASELVTATYDGTGEEDLDPTTQTKVYLSGYDPGKTTTIVRVYATEDGFIGTYPESMNASIGASMPIAGGTSVDIGIQTGELISYVSSTVGAKAYLTPARKV